MKVMKYDLTLFLSGIAMFFIVVVYYAGPDLPVCIWQYFKGNFYQSKETSSFQAGDIIQVENKTLTIARGTQRKIFLMTSKIWFQTLPHMSCVMDQLPKKMYLRDPERVVVDTKHSYLMQNKDLLDKYDVVVFHQADMPNLKTLNYLNKNRRTGQKFAYYTKESPYNLQALSRGKYDGIFDWVVNYKRDSDVFAPYGRYYRIGQEKINLRPLPTSVYLKNYNFTFESKDKLVVWTVSHCGTQRDLYVQKLLRYIPISIYGNCAKLFGQSGGQCKRFNEKCSQKLGRHKFALAFENSFCKDYVTEKYWDALARGQIPIVLGGANYDETLVIPNSFINALDFRFAEDLAKRLLFLAENKEEYMKYHEWRNHYKLDYITENRLRNEYVMEDLCRLAQNPKEGQYRYKLSTFYGVRKNCEDKKALKAGYVRW